MPGKNANAETSDGPVTQKCAKSGCSITGGKHTHMANKADIIDKVHGVLGSTKADAERAVETVIDTIVMSLKSGEEVSIAGLGIFATKARPAREGRNPRTGETIRIPATRTAKFRPAKALKDAVK